MSGEARRHHGPRTPVNTGEQQEHRSGSATRFKPGHSGNPKGRPRGARNKLSEDFLSALAEDFATHGLAAIQRMREDRPHEYIKTIASILPKDIALRATDPLGELSDVELSESIEALRSFMKPGSSETE